MKTRACTLGPRHRWAFLGNTDQITVSGNSVGFSLKGRYECECGARKLGSFQFVEIATQAPSAAEKEGQP